MDTKIYMHRVGRTGRGDQNVQALSFCSSEEKEKLAEIEANLGKAIQRIDITKKEYHNTLKNSDGNSEDWQSLLDEAEQEENFRRKTKKRKKG